MNDIKLQIFLGQSSAAGTGDVAPVPSEGTKEVRWFDDMAIVVGVGLVLMVVLSVWAKFFRTQGGHSRSGSSKKFRSVPDASELSGGESNSERQRKKRRRRRRDHRPRNPTLAETGGLPEIRKPDEGDV